jgi:hypothetical protein|tara:strand:- start:915 stop:1583 length:669 start_codon:yes stop_codon:yes gene_type:complete
MTLSWLQVFILTIIPLGQLYARIFYFKGSLHSEWALFPLFMIPPLQFIPVMMMKLKLIKKGKGGKPYDNFMLIPIILKFVIGFILTGIESPYYQILDFLIESISIMIPFLIRASSNCGELTFESLFNTFSDTTTLQIVIILFSVAIKFIPYAGMFFRITEKIPVIGKLFPWIICYLAGYLIINMINGKNLKKYCGSYPNVMQSVLRIVILIGAKYFTSSLNV